MHSQGLKGSCVTEGLIRYSQLRRFCLLACTSQAHLALQLGLCRVSRIAMCRCTRQTGLEG